MKAILLGAGGREAIIAKELIKDFELYAYMSHANPTIIKTVKQSGGNYIIDKTYDENRIRDFINNNEIEFCICNNDDLLEKGIIDIAKDCRLYTFGPTKEGSRIEWDKAFATELIKKVAPETLVQTKIINSSDELIDTINNYEDPSFVVKPNGLTGGKGVKVGGVHFSSKKEGLDYANQCLEKDGCVIVQDKMIGHEFTIMGFTNGTDLVLAPCTYDHPYRFDGDKGPGTGGMGCTSYSDGLLPFLDKTDIEKCRDVMLKSIKEINKDGIIFNGVLNAGFFKTDKEILFMEFNSRLGDPEALNVLSVMDTPFSKVAFDIAMGKTLNTSNCNFKPIASYVVYVVSKNYAINPTAQPIEFSIDENLLNNGIADLYCSSMQPTTDGKYSSVGNSRLFALVKTGEDLEKIKTDTSPNKDQTAAIQKLRAAFFEDF